jgi:hypothetical protein
MRIELTQKIPTGDRWPVAVDFSPRLGAGEKIDLVEGAGYIIGVSRLLYEQDLAQQEIKSFTLTIERTDGSLEQNTLPVSGQTKATLSLLDPTEIRDDRIWDPTTIRIDAATGQSFEVVIVGIEPGTSCELRLRIHTDKYSGEVNPPVEPIHSLTLAWEVAS